MFKSSLLLLLALSVLVSLAACIQPDIPSRAPETDERLTVPATESETDKPPLSWFGAADRFFDDHTLIDSSSRAYSYTDMQADLEELQARYPAYFSYRSFGKSVAGRNLYVAVLGNPDAARQVLVSAGLHGREYLTPLLCMKQIAFYLQYMELGAYEGQSYRTLFDETCFYIVPMSNPDGIMLSQEGLASLSDPDLRAAVQAIYERDRKRGYTSLTEIDEYLKLWKANANGVDLNRNFDALWEQYRGESAPCHKNYKGPSAASEPETRALAALTEALTHLQAVLCIHSQGEVLYWDCGQPAALWNQTLAFTNAVAEKNGYTVVQEKNNDASYSDWCALQKGLIAITVETGLGSCPLFIDKFKAMWFDNYELLPMTAYYFRGA